MRSAAGERQVSHKSGHGPQAADGGRDRVGLFAGRVFFLKGSSGTRRQGRQKASRDAGSPPPGLDVPRPERDQTPKHDVEAARSPWHRTVRPAADRIVGRPIRGWVNRVNSHLFTGYRGWAPSSINWTLLTPIRAKRRLFTLFTLFTLVLLQTPQGATKFGAGIQINIGDYSTLQAVNGPFRGVMTAGGAARLGPKGGRVC
jgi:hypothetical protein